jgi:hypothetical protein
MAYSLLQTKWAAHLQSLVDKLDRQLAFNTALDVAEKLRLALREDYSDEMFSSIYLGIVSTQHSTGLAVRKAKTGQICAIIKYSEVPWKVTPWAIAPDGITRFRIIPPDVGTQYFTYTSSGLSKVTDKCPGCP